VRAGEKTRSARVRGLRETEISKVRNSSLLRSSIKRAGGVVPEFAAFAGKGAKHRTLQESVVKAVSHDALAARCARAAKILAPITRFTRLCGKAHKGAAQAVPLWAALERELLDAVRRNDFIDYPKHETDHTKTMRFEKVEKILAERKEQFLKPLHGAAFALDPRAQRLIADVQAGRVDIDTLSYDPAGDLAARGLC